MGFAQSQQLPVDRNTQAAYLNKTRAVNGLPGQAYWQNKGDYKIDISFDPTTRKVDGTVFIDYYNNSADTLKVLALKLYPNLYKGNTMRNTVISTTDIGEGMLISDLKIDGHQVENNEQVTRGTNMTIKGVQVLPHGKTMVSINFNYTLNKGSFNRTGQIDEGTFFIAYFFPRITVYDDIDGWNQYHYLGKEEFYNDYGNFKVSVTVPGEYQVWATGDLTNRNDIYQKTIIDRLTKAELNNDIVDIITKDDLKNRNILKNNRPNTWKFEAKDVTDFAFAVSRNYIWKSSSIMVDSVSQRRTRVDAVYNPIHKTYDPVIIYNRKIVEIISHSFPGIPFPYPHLTIIDGLDAMEYPMMVNNLPFEDPKDVVEFTAHEVFHTIFPFYVGINETKYSFMDEGWATMAEFMFHSKIAPEIPLKYDISPVNDFAGMAEDVPVMTPTAQLYGNARYADKDLKPALALWYIKDLLGEKKFAEATRYYILAWAGRHPTPYDFFNCFNKGANINLNWYWKKWYFDKAIPDLSISKVLVNNQNYLITISNIGGAPVPVHLNIYFTDKSKQVISKNITVWQTSNKLNLKIKAKSRIVKITLGDAYDADIDTKNNAWSID
ncbi:M1 family metallopeptidase [Mucilaginibacter lutimaris]|uniref:M1 family metallopeptidase n=2 Tax=Mucilaginibacter lutimaris TaxID=931629 RepID=A0ABW2Z9V4_9SPHI